ncbi:MAG: type I-E CRISPR-associated protein Cas6/Cse3/CasE [Tetrasphaera sp.]
MTYLSRVRLNPTRRDTHRLLASPQAMHAAVMGSHPDLVEDGGQRVLWRVDRTTNHDVQLYVVSPTAPDFVGLIERAGWPTQPQWDCTAYEPFLGKLADRQMWRFRLTANPVRVLPKLVGDPKRRGRVSPHLTVAQQREWLVKRSSSWGFALPSDAELGVLSDVSERHTVSFGRRSERAERSTVTLTRASFAGLLTVVDAAVFRSALVDGMGRAKAYGCGLMTLAPAQR